VVELQGGTKIHGTDRASMDQSYRNFPADYGKSKLSNMAVCDGFVRKTFTNLEIFLQKVRICQ
jgi:hypothetical protein